MKPVAILGCGPAGLMAAQACVLAERPFAIFSKPEKSRLGGAQFLHRPIPGINDAEPDAIITYRKHGDSITYREKVYGDEAVPFTSFDGVEDGQTQQAWNLSATYDRLWTMFGDTITAANVDPNFIDAIASDFEHIFSTVPLPAICRARAGLVQGYHSFRVQDIVVSTERFVHDVEPDTVVYDGTRDHSWYRASLLFGVHGCEWSNGKTQPPVPGLIHDRKPIGTTCDCYQDQVLRLGRRGTWLKGVLTHDAFVNAIEVFM